MPKDGTSAPPAHGVDRASDRHVSPRGIADTELKVSAPAGGLLWQAKSCKRGCIQKLPEVCCA